MTDSPTETTKSCTVKLVDEDESVHILPEHIFNEHNVSATGIPSDSLKFFRPDWLQQGQKVAPLKADDHQHGHLPLSDGNLWEFVTRGTEGSVKETVGIRDAQHSWKMRMQENTFDIGWSLDIARRMCGAAQHVSAATLKHNFAPPNLRTAFAPSDGGHNTWRAACDEECDGLKNLNAFTKMPTKVHERHLKMHVGGAKATPTMNLFAIKPDKEGNPARAKSRIAALGGSEQRAWLREGRCTPALSGPAARLLVSMAVEDGRRLKQGDCKNVFCNGILPEDEAITVKPPQGCPHSKSGAFWKLNKALCGLARPAHHWCTAISGHPANNLGFKAMGQGKCTFKRQSFPDEPPICVGPHVDGFVCHSKPGEVEQWFESKLKPHVEVDFMGDANWFLGQRCNWFTIGGKVACRMPQQAFIEEMLQKFKLQWAKPAGSPCRPGLKADRIELGGKDESIKQAGIQQCQSVLGCFNWLAINSWPGINMAFSLPSQLNDGPSPGHREAAKHALCHLKGTAPHGMWFKQAKNRLEGNVAAPEELRGLETAAFTYSNWGPQDASKPKEIEGSWPRHQRCSTSMAFDATIGPTRHRLPSAHPEW